jgi:hypothetical protein
MVRNNQRKNVQDNALNDAFDFIKRNWLMITGLLIAVPYLMRYLNSQREKTAIANLELDLKEKTSTQEVVNETKLLENQNPLSQNQRRKAITSNQGLWAASASLAHDLGVKYKDNGHWWDVLDPRGWTENDKSARETLVYQRNNFAILEKLYFQVDTNSRSLRADILKYLDKDELKYLRTYMKI